MSISRTTYGGNNRAVRAVSVDDLIFRIMNQIKRIYVRHGINPSELSKTHVSNKVYDLLQTPLTKRFEKRDVEIVKKTLHRETFKLSLAYIGEISSTRTFKNVDIGSVRSKIKKKNNNIEKIVQMLSEVELRIKIYPSKAEKFCRDSGENSGTKTTYVIPRWGLTCTYHVRVPQEWKNGKSSLEKIEKQSEVIDCEITGSKQLILQGQDDEDALKA